MNLEFVGQCWAKYPLPLFGKMNPKCETRISQFLSLALGFPVHKFQPKQMKMQSELRASTGS